MDINHNLLRKQKPRNRDLKVSINLYNYAAELYSELDNNGIIDRIKKISQLGVIKVRKEFEKTRYDYVMLQLYFHKLIRLELQQELRYSYNNKINSTEFNMDYTYPTGMKSPSLGDIFQLLTIVYNVGHFYNTFTASRAAILLSKENSIFNDLIVKASGSERYKRAVRKILSDSNYQKYHLLNSLLILENCDKSKDSIKLALEILYSYINEEQISKDSKLKYAFEVFRNVRNISYIAYDLQIANTPLIIDLCNQKELVLFLKELLSEYNNNQSSINLINSIMKLLDDTIYNETSNAICYYKLSRKMASSLKKEIKSKTINYYNDLFINELSILNRSYTQTRDYLQSQILKLTFTKEQRDISEKLFSELEKMNNTRVGYYDRYAGEHTILVSIRKNSDLHIKRSTAYKVLKCVIKYLNRISNISTNDVRFLLVTKFFFFYLFNENPVLIKHTISKDKCVICTRGKNKKERELKSLLDISRSILKNNDDVHHEVEFLKDQIISDSKNDITVIIPSSIIVYQKEELGKILAEFDGLIIHPMRKKYQILFLEAKNIKKRPGLAKNCLVEKLNKIDLMYDEENIQTVKSDAYLKYSVFLKS